MNKTETATMKQFVNENKIKIDSVLVDENPNMDSDHDMNHFKVTLRARVDGKRKQFTTFFSMGMGLRGDPQVDDVLDCIASDSASIENARDFEDWAGEFGYDTDSRKAERIYKICQRQAERLKAFVGSEKYTDLLWNTERL